LQVGDTGYDATIGGVVPRANDRPRAGLSGSLYDPGVVRVDDFDFELPEELIAQAPPAERGTSRLLVLDRATGDTRAMPVAGIVTCLRAGDLLVVNDTRVFPARLLGRRDPSGGHVECLLLQRDREDEWQALVHPGQKLKPGARMIFEGEGGILRGEIIGRGDFGKRRVRLAADRGADVMSVIEAIGHMPLPPYIKRPDTTADRERYQTIFARDRGSVAAPTAGLHFTPAMIEAIAARGVERVAVTLHVGFGTFKPVRVESVEDHVVDPESYAIPEAAAEAIARAKREGRRVVAIGTTTTRALESAAAAGSGVVRAGSGTADIFIRPGHRFAVVDALFTNFHVPRSSLLMLVCAFAGRDAVLAAYRGAVAQGFRFYSYGDAMFVA
jgi:S-adenosylmethionine:tRNA ribosyltransferase-isomerase